MSHAWKLKKTAFEYIYLPCVHIEAYTEKMKLKKCIMGRPGYFDMVNKTKQNKTKLKKQKKKKETKTKTKEDTTKQSK